jgi:hypothetical protein
LFHDKIIKMDINDPQTEIRGNTLVIAIVVGAAMIITAAVTWFIATRYQTPTISPQATENQQSAISINQTQQVSSGLIYKDTVNGYQLKLPSDWTGYKVNNYAKAVGYSIYSFSLPTNDSQFIQNNSPKGYADALDIGIYSLSYFNKNSDNNGPYCGSLGGPNLTGGYNWGPHCYIIGRTDMTVFVAGWPVDAPNDSQWEEISNGASTEAYLKANFSLISGSATAPIANNLLTYANSSYGFSFQYPAPFENEEGATEKWQVDSNINHIAGKNLINIPVDTAATVSILYDNRPPQDASLGVDVYNAPLSSVMAADYFKGQSSVKTTINGISWTKTKYDFYLTEHNGKTYSINGISYVVDPILSTFKFTK